MSVFKFLMLAPLGFASLGLLTCDAAQPRKQPTKLTIRGVTYQIPREDIGSQVLDPPQMAYVRIERPEAKFHLILDAFSPYFPNKLGTKVPTITLLNSDKFGEYEAKSVDRTTVVCRRNSELHFNCGFEIEDHAVKWDVLFDRKYIGHVGAFRAEATKLISSYRREPQL